MAPWCDRGLNYIIGNNTFYTIKYNSSACKGKIQKYDNIADIYVSERKMSFKNIAQITECEERFIIIKEAAHLVIDTKDSHVEYIGETLLSI